MDLLNLSRPWDCESFPKSKTICYGGGGGGGGSIGDNPLVKKVAKQTGYTGSDLDKTGQAVEKAVTGGAEQATETVKAVVAKPPPILKKASEGFDEFGRRIKKGASSTIESVKKDVSSGIEKKKTLISSGVEHTKKEGSKAIEDAKTGASSTIESVKKDVAQSDIGKATSAGIENIKKEGSKVIEHTKGEIGKLASGEFSLKKAITGTASGASKTFKESDLGVVTKKIAKETGYTGSDFDKTMQKAESETSNVVNQTLDFVDSPGKVILSNVKKADQYIKRQMGVNVPTGQELLAQGIVSVGKLLQKKPTETKAGPGGAVTIGGGTGPGSGKTLGSGKVQGLQGGAAMDTSRARVRQNKRKLRIS